MEWNLIITIRQFLNRNWKVEICYTLREGNKCTDRLSKLALLIPQGEHSLDDPPHELREMLRHDALGGVSLRNFAM